MTDNWSRRGSATNAVATVARPNGTTTRGVYRYSSLNYLLLQAVIEQATGEPYAVALEREVLQPSGATATITGAEEFVTQVPPGHVPFFWGEQPMDVGFDSAGLGYGYLAGSTEGLGGYASWRMGQLRQGGAPGPEVATGGSAEYGSGLFHEVIGGEEVWWHAGAVPGYYTYVAMVPSLDRAVVLATNSYGEIEAERIAAVGRALIAETTGGESTELPRSPATPILGVLTAAVLLFGGVIVWTLIRLFTGRTRTRSPRNSAVRIAIIFVAGGAVLIGVVAGVPTITGASLPTMWRWAPDVTLLLWTLLGAVFGASALGIAVELGNRGRSGRRPSP